MAVLNAGSSSIKFAIHAASPEAPRLLGGQIEAIGIAPRLRLNDAGGALLKEQTWDPAGFDHAAATRAIVTAVREVLGESPIDAVGHRVAHGGTRFRAPVRVDAAVLEYLAKLIPLAPLHQPHNLEPIQAILELPKHMPQVACFDTEFHSGQAAVARTYALPRELTAEGVLRYGFHGLSYEYVSARLRSLAPKLAAGRVVIAHLGNGASLCAVDNGHSVATTMGFTGVEGLVMGTRCGTIDPGVLLYLMDSHGMGAREIEELIYRRCGLLGVSGISADMRALRASTEPAAAEAIAAVRLSRDPRNRFHGGGSGRAWMGWCLPRASARTTRPRAPKWPRAAPGWALSWMKREMREAKAASARMAAASRPG